MEFCCSCFDKNNLKPLEEYDITQIEQQIKFIIPEIPDWGLKSNVICTYCYDCLNAAFEYKNIVIDAYQTFVKNVESISISKLDSSVKNELELEEIALEDNSGAEYVHFIVEDCKSTILEIGEQVLSDTSEKNEEPDQIFKCFECNDDSKVFSSKQKLSNHIKKAHSKAKTELKPASPKSKYACPKCNVNCRQKKFLIRHFKTCGNEFECSECEKSYETEELLQKHKRATHKEIKIEEISSCPKCDRIFTNKKLIRPHLQICKVEELNYICSKCGKGFKTPSYLKRHEETHAETNNFTCEICAKSFKAKLNLRLHRQNSHTDPSTWTVICNICNKKFPSKANYNMHMKRHLGIKNYTCPLCGKGFVHRADADMHIDSHSGIRKHKCDQCGTEYRKKRDMLIHRKRVHGLGTIKVPTMEKKHICEICLKGFCEKNKLRRHLLIHSKNATKS